MFAFEKWHSALEMKLYLHRFIHHIDGLPDLSALRFTRYNQYESMIIILRVAKAIAGKSRKFFVNQQKALGNVNGYIEEMINGQKVIKVFCHEEESAREFDRRNSELCAQATEANKFANIFMNIPPSEVFNRVSSHSLLPRV